MPILNYNVGWMSFNCFLALLPVLFGYVAYRTKNTYLKVIFGVLWFLFLPNTIYIFTDLVHLIPQWHYIGESYRSLLVLQYFVFESIGIITFLLAFYPFERIIRVIKLFKNNKILSLVIFNFIIAFGMVLGRVERINSWQVFTNPPAVTHSALHVILTPSLLGLTILFGFLCNFIYFLFRSWTVEFVKRVLD
ncbi:MAG TPA: DUF1361 domain-containing protein [Candidatus Saccharimonadales bacterium]|nr:DUF1361 domain-containing protein [Candidatus Saccharimonadales bacterium]